nr:MAG TPA: hypothetical protein [Bacteriophage sp.]
MFYIDYIYFYQLSFSSCLRIINIVWTRDKSIIS